MQFFLLPFNLSGKAFLLFFAGTVSIVNGTALFFNDRKLNKWLTSTLLINGGVMLIYDGLNIIGYPKFDAVKVSTLIVQTFIGILSIFLVWGHYYERNKKIQERTLENPSSNHDPYDQQR